MIERGNSNIVECGWLHRQDASGDFTPKGDRAQFFSILFPSPADRIGDDDAQAPEFFADLNCDQIVNVITLGRDDYNLRPFFYACLRRTQVVEYRHEVMQDLERPPLFERVSSFANQMREVRDRLAQFQKMHYKEQKEAWLVDAVVIYCELIKSFAAELALTDLKSRGFLAFRDYLQAYSDSDDLNAVYAQIKTFKAELAAIEYCVLIKGSTFTVQKYDSEADYSAEVESTFAKFEQGELHDYRVKFSVSIEMNHVEGKILEFVAKLYPNVFDPLGAFCMSHCDFIDRTVAAFDREVQFYLAYLEYVAPLRRAGLQFCYPAISDVNRDVHAYDTFDIALAQKLCQENIPVVCNDFFLKEQERIIVVSGPNQGGKTTFARAVGQLKYLANIGCPVPGREARLFLFDRIFTHFEREERVEDLRGKLEDDLIRIRTILDGATRRSIIILNEIFNSTTIQDETFLSKRVMEQIIGFGSLCVWVTFVDELASFGPEIVSMVSTVDRTNPARRTFKILRRPADGLAYAMAIVRKYGLTYDAICERIRP